MNRSLIRMCIVGAAILLINSALLWAFPAATAFNTANVLFHVAAGALVGMAALLLSRAEPRLIWLVAAAASGALLAAIGNTRDHRSVLLIHVVVSLVAVAVLLSRKQYVRAALFSAGLAALILTAGIWFRFLSAGRDRITNSRAVPLSMDQEGAGPQSEFFPSAAKTSDGRLIPAGFFLESKKCGECHRDIYEQWQSSAHHFASFNNQFYRKSIEYMQSIVGTKPSKWCAGCHDHAVFFNGRFDRPIKEQINTPEAQAGLSCMSCHSIVHVAGSVGNGGFTISYPPLHEVASSSNPVLRNVEHFVTYAAPEAHRRTFMKPFIRDGSAEFCASCHKVHLDVPVNNYRWLRGFNEYDNWQASGVSGEGARSFYYPAKSSNCADCHMPLVASHDPGNRNGMIHSHRFPGANTAVPFVNNDKNQLDATEKFLKAGIITVDIFAIRPAAGENSESQMIPRGDNAPQEETSFAVGEEAEHSTTLVVRDVGRIAAPIDRSGVSLQPGETARVDVVVRTRTVGHFFPGGTVDAFDVWLELKAQDDEGRTIFWSGRVEDGGKGPVEPSAHFYRSYQLDAAGNPINKRNAWQTRSLLYVRLIPPGAADAVHYLIKVPRKAQGQIHFTAKLNYRKFSWYYTHFSYAGEPNPSGNIKGHIPELPIVTLASARVSVPISEQPVQWTSVSTAGTWERWNDWGIGLLLEGDLKSAEFAFRKAAEAEPGYADAWLNVARTLIQEGETEAAKPFLNHALQIDPSLGRIYYFRALTEKADGNYDAALASLERVESQYPRDRVVLNQIARILFLKRQYARAIAYLERVCDIDPEDVQMHYTAMLCYRGLGDVSDAKREALLFERFKADEKSQAITAQPRMANRYDNNERQLIHDHQSAPLAPK